MEKSDLSPCVLRDAPDGHGHMQAPAPYIIIPGRAYGDTRMHKYPKTFLILSLCCAHSNAQKGSTLWVNQQTFANMLGVSQQAVSQAMNKLCKWGYMEKIRTQNPLRTKGRKGATWRVIYEPRYSLEEAIKYAPEPPKTPEQEYQDAQNTIDKANRGAKGHMTQKKKSNEDIQPQVPVDNSVDNSVDKKVIQAPACTNDAKYKLQLVQRYKPQLVNNNNSRTVRNREENCRSLCRMYSDIHMTHSGLRWQWTVEQERIAGDLIDLGYDEDTFAEMATGVVKWFAGKNSKPPHSLQYFIIRHRNKKKGNAKKDSKQVMGSVIRSLRP
tara:strand:+ start:633 stop:1610 length:978 start_codon:yes stop_codon:yes gene_type:complete